MLKLRLLIKSQCITVHWENFGFGSMTIHLVCLSTLIELFLTSVLSFVSMQADIVMDSFIPVAMEMSLLLDMGCHLPSLHWRSKTQFYIWR